MPAPVITVSHLGKRYGATVAVNDVLLEVPDGEIFGRIGSTGAGRTTTMASVEGLRTPDRGSVLPAAYTLLSTKVLRWE